MQPIAIIHWTGLIGGTDLETFVTSKEQIESALKTYRFYKCLNFVEWLSQEGVN